MTSLETVFNLVGAIASNMILIILPTLLYHKLIDKVYVPRFGESAKNSLYYITKSYYFFGYIILIVCVTSEILRII